MAAKLKSISRQIHWSLVLRAAVFALAWAWFPFWLFVLIALYLYFVPWFQAGRLAVPFFTLLLLCYLQTPGVAFAIIFAAVFYVLFLIKDLLIIDRRSAYELLVLALAFFLLRDFYAKFSEGLGGAALFCAFLAAAVLTLLLQSFMNAFYNDAPASRSLKRAAVWLSFLLLSQALIAGLFLPVDFIYQSALVFLVAVLLVELVPEYLFAGFSRTKMLATAMTVFTLFVIVMSSARWEL